MSQTLLLIGGSLREGSTNEAVLRTAQHLAPADVLTCIYSSVGALPHFNPDDDREPLRSVVADLRRQVGAAHALLLSTPEYGGALPGAFKNLLDWLVGGSEMDGEPVAWISAAGPAAPAGGEDAHASLRKVLGHLGAEVVEPACARIPVTRRMISSGGLIHDDGVRAGISGVLGALLDRLKVEQPSR